MQYQSKRTGPVSTTVRVRPFESLVVAIVLAVIGGAAIVSLTPGGILIGGFVLWWAFGGIKVSLRQIQRAIETYFS